MFSGGIERISDAKLVNELQVAYFSVRYKINPMSFENKKAMLVTFCISAYVMVISYFQILPTHRT